MSILKKISLAVATVAVVSTSSFAANVIVGGNIPLINSIAGIGVLTLDLSNEGTDVNIATFIVNNNAPGFTVQWSLVNGGYFRGTSGDIQITGCELAGGTGTLGTGAAAVTTATLDLTGAVAGVAEDFGPWTVTQTTATENYVVLMNATWASSTAALAGLYTETIEYTITATL